MRPLPPLKTLFLASLFLLGVSSPSFAQGEDARPPDEKKNDVRPDERPVTHVEDERPPADASAGKNGVGGGGDGPPPNGDMLRAMEQGRDAGKTLDNNGVQHTGSEVTPPTGSKPPSSSDGRAQGRTPG
jgi:hypothetical protein